MSQPTKFTVISHDKFSELGYVPLVHPDGYIYFAKNNIPRGDDEKNGELCQNGSVDEHINVARPSSSTNNQANASYDQHDGVTHASNQDNKTEMIPKPVKMPSKVYTAHKKISTGLVTSSPDDIIQTKPEIPIGKYLRRRAPRAVHVESWKIKMNLLGYISCHFSKCRFIAMSVMDMSVHFGHCVGDSSFAKFPCPFCNGVVTTHQILDIHIARSHKAVKKNHEMAEKRRKRPLILQRKTKVPPHTVSIFPEETLTLQNTSKADGRVSNRATAAIPAPDKATFEINATASTQLVPLPTRPCFVEEDYHIWINSGYISGYEDFSIDNVRRESAIKDKRNLLLPPIENVRIKKECDSWRENEVSGNTAATDVQIASNEQLNCGIDYDYFQGDLQHPYYSSYPELAAYTVASPLELAPYQSPWLKSFEAEKFVKLFKPSVRILKRRLSCSDSASSSNVTTSRLAVRRKSVGDSSAVIMELLGGPGSGDARLGTIKGKITQHLIAAQAELQIQVDAAKCLKKNPGKSYQNRSLIKNKVNQNIPVKEKVKSSAQKPHKQNSRKSNAKTKTTKNADVKFPTKNEKTMPSTRTKRNSELDVECSGLNEVIKKQNKDNQTTHIGNISGIHNFNKTKSTVSKLNINETNNLAETPVRSCQASDSFSARMEETRQLQNLAVPKGKTSAKLTKRTRTQAGEKGEISESLKAENINISASTKSTDFPSPTTKDEPILKDNSLESTEVGIMSSEIIDNKNIVPLDSRKKSELKISYQLSSKNSLNKEDSVRKPTIQDSTLTKSVLANSDHSAEKNSNQEDYNKKTIAVSTIKSLASLGNNVSQANLATDVRDLQQTADLSYNALPESSGNVKIDAKVTSSAITSCRLSTKRKNRIISDSDSDMDVDSTLQSATAKVNSPKSGLDSAVVKRKRGRPCRAASASTSDILSESNHNKTNVNSEKTMKVKTYPEEAVTPLFETPVVKRKRGRQRRALSSSGSDTTSESYHNQRKPDAEKTVVSITDTEAVPETPVVKRKQGRPRRTHGEGIPRPPSPRRPNDVTVTCGKCGESMARRKWDVHNNVRHIGLGWLSDEIAFDPKEADSHEVLCRVRRAFRNVKSATCEICGVVKKSFLGYHAHITICGKSEEDRRKSMATCEICGKAVMPYSVSSHMKMHTENVENVEENESSVPAKRRSAVKAMSTMQQVIAVEKKSYIHYKKGDILPFRCSTLYPRLGLGKEKCQRKGCDVQVNSIKGACMHFMNCPMIPDAFYLCIDCHFIGETHEATVAHNCTPINELNSEGENSDGVASSEDENDVVKTSKSEPPAITPAELDLRKRCIRRESLFLARGSIYERAFDYELSRQNALLALDKQFPQLRTSPQDWVKLPEPDIPDYLPPYSKSLPFCHKKSGISGLKVPLFELYKSHVFLRYHSDLDCYDSAVLPSRSSRVRATVSMPYVAKDITVGFTGGPIQTLAWCPINMNDSGVVHQYLALSTTGQYDEYPLMDPTSKSALLQVWDVGPLTGPSGGKLEPKMVAGIAMDFGELWDLAWCPNDSRLCASGNSLARIGLLAAAFHDGDVRIFSISCPSTGGKAAIYRVAPAVQLCRASEEDSDACFRVCWGDDGVVCGGFQSGHVAIWYLSTLSSPRTVRHKTTYILKASRVFLAHTYPITGVALCPGNSRLLATGGTDRKLHFWDVTNLSTPYRSELSYTIPHVQWFRHWPLQLYLYDDNIGAGVTSTFASMSCNAVKVSSVVMDISVSNWGLTSVFGTSAGELVMRQHCDPFHDQRKIIFSTIAATATFPKSMPCMSYSEANSMNAAVSFSESKTILSLDSSTADELCLAQYNPTSVDKVAFNPNYKTFHYVAVGYQCGFLRLVKIDHMSRRVEKIFEADRKSAKNDRNP